MILCGGTAFTVAVVICMNPFCGPEGRAARRFVMTVGGFALAATVIQLAPFQLLMNGQLRFMPYAVRWAQILYSPGYFATGIALALLPAAILVPRITRSKIAMAIGLCLVAAFFASKVIAPRTSAWRQELARQEMFAHMPPAAQKSWQAHERQSQLEERERRRRDETGAWAHIARVERHEDAAFAVMAAAFALLGLAIGRARATVAPLGAATVWWFFAWMGYQLLQFWANRLRIVAPTPIEVAIWIPPLAVLTIAIVAARFADLPPSLKLRRTRKVRAT